MKFNNKILSNSVKKNLRELAMQKPPRFNPHPDIEGELARGHTSIPRSTMPERGFEAPNTNFQELLASERYREVVQKLQDYLGGAAPRGLQGGNVMELLPLVGLMQNATIQVSEIESEHREELETLAVELVMKELGVPGGKINYVPHIVGLGDIDTGDFARDRDQQQQQQQQQQQMPQMPNQQEMEAELAQRLMNFDLETAKRRVINAILQGASKRGHYMYHMVANELEHITGSDELIGLYGVLMSINDTLYWQFSNQMMGQAMEGEDFVGGKEKVTRNTDPPTVEAWGVNFPILVHELIKGTYEIIGIHGQPFEGFENIKASEDTLDKEIWDLRLGPAIWARLRDLFPEDILTEDNQKQVQLFLLTAIFRLPAREFLVFIKEALQKSDEGKRLIASLLTGARDNMRRLEARQRKQTAGELDTRQAEKFQNEVKRISEETSEKDIDSFLDSLGIGKPKSEPTPQAPETTDIDDVKLSGMGLNELNFQMNKAIDTGNWELVQRIQRMIDRKQGNLK